MLLFVNVATGSWQEDQELKEQLQRYVNRGLQNTEILSFMKRDFDS